jgi:hypothetical protein
MRLPLILIFALTLGPSGLHADNLCVADDSKLSVETYLVAWAEFPAINIFSDPVRIISTGGYSAYCFCMLTAASGEKYLVYTYAGAYQQAYTVCPPKCDALRNKYLQ